MKYISLLMFLVSVTCSSLVYSQVGIKYDIDASNPMGVIAAMDKFYASSTGQAASGSVTLYQYVANGDNSATHAFIVAFYKEFFIARLGYFFSRSKLGI